jgi:uncharacterized membrane protein YuzA (DUF378 family)
MKNLRTIDYLVIALIVVGGLNWGLVGLFNFDLVAALFGDMSAISRIIYILVGVSAVALASMSVCYGKKASCLSRTA